MRKTDRAIVFMAWGEKYINEVLACIKRSELPEYDILLITDEETEVEIEDVVVIRREFKTKGLMRKIELARAIPKEYKSYLFLDSDTRVLSDIRNGFEKAELHGIAASPAPHYSLDHFWGFNKVMEKENVRETGQLQYNTGVIFFVLNEKTLEVFHKWHELGENYSHVIENDQPFFSLAMEMCGFNPYTLSIGYNYRGFGDAISGIVRIWHSHTEMPLDINELGNSWPPRRVIDGKVHYTRKENDKWYLEPVAWVKDVQ